MSRTRTIGLQMEAVLAIVWLSMSLPSPAAADDCATFSLTNGNAVEGKVIESTADSITVSTRFGAIATTVTYRLDQINNLHRFPCDDAAGFGEVGDPASAEAVPADPANGQYDYILIPIDSGIGFSVESPSERQVTAAGLQEALQRATQKGIPYAMLYIDSPGGYVYEAQEIMRVLDKFRGQIKLVALVESSLSAAMWVTFGCDRIFVMPGARAGAAVAYSGDPGSGSAEVDAKFTSAVAAEMAGWAEKNGHSGDVARAMADMTAELWAQRSGSSWAFFPSKPSGDARGLDGPESVLTLTGSQMVEFGIAEPADSPDDVGKRLSEESWHVWRGAGERLIYLNSRALAAEVSALDRRFSRLLGEVNEIASGAAKRLPSSLPLARASEPNARRYESELSYSTGELIFTAQGRREWLRANDRCIGHWRDAEASFKQIDSCADDLRRFVRKNVTSDNPQIRELHSFYQESALDWLLSLNDLISRYSYVPSEADEMIKRLRRNRTRRGP